MGDDMKKAMLAVTDGVVGAGILLAGGVYGGSWLDHQFHCSPWFSIGLAMVGGGFGLARMVYKATQLGSSSAEPRLPKTSVRTHAQTPDTESPEGGIRQKRPFEDLDDEEN